MKSAHNTLFSRQLPNVIGKQKESKAHMASILSGLISDHSFVER